MAPRTEIRNLRPPVLLVGFSEEDLPRLEHLLGDDLPLLVVPEEAEARRLLREREVSLVVVGGGLRGERACLFVAEARERRPEGASSFLVVGAGPDLARFQELVDEDALFFLSREALGSEELAALVRSAVSRRAVPVREPGQDAAGVQQALAAARRVAMQRDLCEAGALVAEEVENLLGADRAYSLIHDAEEEVLRAGETDSPEERVESPAVGLVSFVVRTGQPVALETVGADPRYEREADDPRGAGTERFLAVPMRGANGGVIGTLAAVREPRRPAFSDRDRGLLQRLAGFVGSTLEQLALQESLDREVGEQERPGADPIFRREALEARDAGLRDSGELLRLSPGRACSDGARTPRSLRSSRGRARIPYVQQTAVSDCGSACLAMVLGFHGRQIGLAEVRDVLGHGRGGADALRLLETGRWFGLHGRAVRVESLDELHMLPRGAILHWRFRHFVVFDRAVEGGLEILDPAGGRRRVPEAEANRAFTGVALVFEPTGAFQPGGDTGRGPRQAWRYLRHVLAERGLLQKIVATSVLVQLFALSVPFLIGILVDRVLPGGERHLLAVLGAGLAAIVGFHFLASLIRSRLLLHLRTKLDSRLTVGFLDHMVRLPYEFFQTRSAGDLLMRLSSNATIREILTSGVLSAVLDGLLVFLYLVLLFGVSVSMTGLVVVLGAVRVGVFLAVRRRHRDTISQTLHQQARSQGYQVQMLAGMETLKATGAEHRAVEHWSHLFVDGLNASVARGRLEAWVDSALSALAIGSPLAILLYGGHLVLAGELSLGLMLAVNALGVGFLQPLSKLVETAFDFQRMGSYLDRIEDVLDTPQEQAGRETVLAPRLRGRITLEDVSFRYAAALPPVVSGVTVEIERGSFVALVGRSGAGKSTLAALMVGLYMPQEGTIAFDGRPLPELDLGSVRRQVGIVPQHPYLFGGTVRGNVALSDPGLRLGEVMEAARRAQVHEEIAAMPMGYDTALADGGTSLSGGQRQRIALARALATRPAILLLDEATSHLDAITEARIHQELEGLRATRIVISHRLSTVRRADQILVLEGGRIVERGSHEELVARSGPYLELVEEQLEKDGEEPGPLQSSRIAAVGDE